MPNGTLYISIRFLKGEFKVIFLDIHLYIKRNHEIYDLGEIKQNDDGSLYIFLPTNESKNKFKKTSIHTSGRINFDLKQTKVQYIEPLAKITKINFICSVYIPSFASLKQVPNNYFENNINNPQSIIFLELESIFKHFTISFFLSPNEVSNVENNIVINLHDMCFFNISISGNVLDDRSKDLIMLYTAHNSAYTNQLIDRFEAEKDYRNILYKTNQATLVVPDHNGTILLHFSNVMHHTPYLFIEFEDSNLYVNNLEGNKTKLRFKIKNAKRGNQIVFDPNRIKIKELILDAEIYDDGYIPDGYLKSKEL